MIRDSPSHIYHSALPLTPSSSWIRQCYKTEIAGEVRVLRGLPQRWDTCSRTVLLEDKPTAFAYWGHLIAVGLGSDVVLLDAITGIRNSVLSDHRDTIRSLAFSLDGSLLVSRADDKTVKLWDVQTGVVVRTLGNEIPVVSAVSISPGGTTIALGTRNGVIRLWDIRTRRWQEPDIQTRQDTVAIISFSPFDSRRLLSSSGDRTVRQWDVDGNQIGSSYHEAGQVVDLSYSSDGTRFVSCGGGVATIRDSESGAVLVKLDAPDWATLHRCCFSPDGRFVACSAGDSICVWDITNPESARLVEHLVGHSESVSFITFPSSLISVSGDRSVKFWQSSSFMADSILADHTAALHGSTLIKSVKLFAKDKTVVTSDDSGMVKTWDLATGRCKSSTPTKTMEIRDTHMEGNTLIIVWCTDGQEYHVWDVYRKQSRGTFHSSLYSLRDLKISGDGTKIFGLGHDCIEAVSLETGENIGCVDIEEESDFFVRGSKVGMENSRGRGWDFGGPEVSGFGEFSDRPRLDLVDAPARRGLRLRWVEDIRTKRQVFRIPERYTKHDTRVEWDGRYLLLWSSSGEVVVIDFDSVCHRQGSS